MSAREQLNEMKKFRQLMEDIENDDDLGPIATGKSKLVKDFADEEGWEVEDFPLAESEERPYICYHNKKGKHECTADSSYGAAKKAAEAWGLKSTAGVSATLADVKQSTQFVGENDDVDGRAFIDDYESKTADNNPCMYCDGGDESCEVCHGQDEMFEGMGSEFRLAEIVGKDGLAELLSDLRTGGIDYLALYFDKLYNHFLDEYPDEIPVGSRTGRPEDPEEYVQDNLERYHQAEIEQYWNTPDMDEDLSEGPGDDTDWDAHWAREDGDDERADDLEADAEWARMDADDEDDLDEDFPAQASEQECAWWAGCNNDATTTEPHPVLGDVPICDRCVAKLRKIEGLDEDDGADGMGHYEVVVRRGVGTDDFYEDVVSGPVPFDEANKEALQHVRMIKSESASGAKVKKSHMLNQVGWTIRPNSYSLDDKYVGGFVFIRPAEDADVEAWYGEGVSLDEADEDKNLGPYEDNTEKWQGQTVKITGGKYQGEVGKVVSADWYYTEDGVKEGEYTVKLHSGPVVTLYLGEWTHDQIELMYDPTVRPDGKYDPAMEEINLGSIVESILEDFPGQPKDYEASDEDDVPSYAKGKSAIAKEFGATDVKDFERDTIDPEIEDEELGLRFD